MKQQRLILIPEQMKQQSLEQWTDTAKIKWKRSSPNLSEAGDPTKKGASNDDKTIGISTTKAKVDYYPRANKAAKAEIIDIDKDDEKKANDTGGASATKVDYYPRANEAAKFEAMNTDTQNPTRSKKEDVNLGPSWDNEESVDNNNNDEKKVNETAKVDSYPRTNKAAKVETMDTETGKIKQKRSSPSLSEAGVKKIYH